MAELKKGERPVSVKRLDTKEFEIPETVFIRDIDPKLLQEIVLQCLAKIPGIAVVEGTLIDSIFGRGMTDKGASILAEQDIKKHSVSIKVEVNISYGISLPEKAEEIQTKIAEEITELTGLHVATVHVVFRGLIQDHPRSAFSGHLEALGLQAAGQPSKKADKYESEYNDDF